MRRLKITSTDIIAISTIVVACILLYYWLEYRDNTKNKTTGTSVEKEHEIHIPRNIKLKEGETVEIVRPQFTLNGTHAKDVDVVAGEVCDKLKAKGIEPIDAYGNEDGSITLVFDSKHLENFIVFTEDSLSKSIYNDEDIPVEINDTFTHITYYIPNDCTVLDYGIRSMSISQYMTMAQILSGVPCDEWVITHTLMYEDSDIVIYEMINGVGNNYEITETQWNIRMQEVRDELAGRSTSGGEDGKQ